MSVVLRLTSVLLNPTKDPRLPVLMFVGTATPERTPPLLKGIPLRSGTTEGSPRADVRAGGGGTATIPRLGTATPRLMS